MLAGEFAVLEPNHTLLVMAVNRYVYATVTDTTENELSLHDFQLHHLKWGYIGGSLSINASDERIGFVQAALEIVVTYLKENDIQTTPFHLEIKSELDD